MIPLRDANPTRRPAVVTLAIVIACCVVFAWELGLGAGSGEAALERMIGEWGVVPARLTAAWVRGDYLSGDSFTLLSSQFLHGGWLHLLGNMLYLWIFGNNVEDTLGHARFTVFYVVSGAVAAAAQTALSAASSVPMIGASGAVSGVLGAYLLLFPRANVLTLIVFGFFVRIVRVPAILVIGLWFVVQFVSGLATWGTATARGEALGGETAWFAHLGGFLAGMVLLFALRPRTPGDGGAGRSG